MNIRPLLILIILVIVCCQEEPTIPIVTKSVDATLLKLELALWNVTYETIIEETDIHLSRVLPFEAVEVTVKSIEIATNATSNLQAGDTLIVNESPINVEITAEDGSTVKIYQLILETVNYSIDRELLIGEIIKNGNGLFPLSVGNYWIYNNYKVKGDKYYLTKQDKHEVIDSLNIQYEGIDYKAYKLEYVSVFFDTTTFDTIGIYGRIGYLSHKDGVTYDLGYYEDETQAFNRRIVIKDSLSIGEYWLWDYGDYADGYLCTNVSDTVYVYGDEYDCITIQRNPTTGFNSYYTRGVGLIMQAPATNYEEYSLRLLYKNRIN